MATFDSPFENIVGKIAKLLNYSNHLNLHIIYNNSCFVLRESAWIYWNTLLNLPLWCQLFTVEELNEIYQICLLDRVFIIRNSHTSTKSWRSYNRRFF